MNTNIFNYLSYGVYIVTTMDGDKPVGCTANCAMQVTAVPATIAVSINHDNYTHACIEKTGKFAISILKETSDPIIIGAFGFSSSKNIDKFKHVSYEMKEGLPVLTDACGYIICNVIDKFETLTHTIFLGDALEGELGENPESAMTYAYYHKELKGKTSKNAPTFQTNESTSTGSAASVKTAPTEKIKEAPKKATFVCEVCGYEYFEDSVPADFICPICGQGADVMKTV